MDANPALFGGLLDSLSSAATLADAKTQAVSVPAFTSFLAVGPGNASALLAEPPAAAQPAVARTRVLYANPGVAISGSDLDFGDLSTASQINAASYFSQLVNAISADGSVWIPSATHVWDVYGLVLEASEFPRPSALRPTPDAAVATLARTIGWTQTKFSQIAASLARNQRSNLVDGSTYFTTLVKPENALGAQARLAWTPFRIGARDAQNVRIDSPANISSSYASFYFHNNPQPGVQNRTASGGTDLADATLSGELLSLAIWRPWFSDADLIFQNRAWRFSPDSGFSDVCDGGTPPRGLMPFYASSVLLVRDLSVSFGQRSAMTPELSGQIADCASATLGPFVLKGTSAIPGSGATVDATVVDDGLHTRGVQIIGFMCTTLPKTPNPNPGLVW